MRVLMLKEALPTGGAERQLALIMKYLPADWERRVWTMGGGPFVEIIERDGQRVDVCRREARLDVRPAAQLWRLLLRWRPDVVHSWDWMSSAAALPLCLALRIPVVDATVRNGIARRRRSLPLRLVHAASARVVANSWAGLDAWGVGTARGRVVYNGFDPERLALCAPREPDDTTRRARCRRAGGRRAPRTAGGLRRGGGEGRRSHGGDDRPHDAAQGFRHADPRGAAAGRRRRRRGGRICRRVPAAATGGAARAGASPWRFVLLGDGPERPRLEELAGDLVGRGVVAFVDPGLEVLPFLRDADVGVLMSAEQLHREGCSNAIMEYMASGLPVVCSRGGGNPELVADGATGYLVTAGDARGLAARLAGLAADPAGRARMGAAGRSRLLEEFNVERMIARLVRVYDEVVTA